MRATAAQSATRASRRLVWLRSVMTGVLVAGVVVMIPSISTMSTRELVIIAFIAYGVLGVRITYALPANPIGWTFLFVGTMTGLAGLAGGLVDLAVAIGDTTSSWAVLAAWLTTVFWFPLIMAATIFTFLLFPTGLPSPRWRPVAWFAVAVTLVGTFASASQPVLSRGEGADASSVPNPLVSHLPAWWAWALDNGKTVGGATVLALLAISLGALVLRYRRGNDIEREQLRWFAFAAVVLVCFILLPDNGGPLNDILLSVVLTLFPVSCGLAILRYRLYDIDRLISRTASYAIVTMLVIATYAVVVTTITSLLPDSSSSLAVAAATLSAATLARPLLRRVQHAVDRRFNRARYDAQRTVDAFCERLRNEVAADLVMADLRNVVTQTLTPTAVSVWLRDA